MTRISDDPAVHRMPKRRPDHGITIGSVIAGAGRIGAHVALCLCGFVGAEHRDRRDAVSQGRAHVDGADRPVGSIAWTDHDVTVRRPAWMTDAQWSNYRTALAAHFEAEGLICAGSTQSLSTE